jgi:hypothetical protein
MIFGAGVLGPRAAPRSGATLEPDSSAGASAVAVAPPASPSPSAYPEIAALAGVARFNPAPADLRASWLAGNISSQTLAAVGTRLYFVTGDTLQSTVIGSGARPKTIVTMPACQTISQVAAAGNAMGFVQTGPAVVSGDGAVCSHPSSVAWTIWLGDLDGRHLRAVASGLRPVDSAATRQHPVRLALTASTYAFNRPNSPGLMAASETILVRRVSDDRLLWNVRTDAYVSDLMLGGSTLAIVETEPELELSVADSVNPALTHIALPASAAALSEDGTYLTWDTHADAARNVPAGLVTVELGSGSTTSLAVAANSAQPKPLAPAISSTPMGPIVAWYSTLGGGLVYPAFHDYADDMGGVYSTVQAPIWIGLRGSTLILVSTDSDGAYTVAFALDLSRSGFGATANGGPEGARGGAQ